MLDYKESHLKLLDIINNAHSEQKYGKYPYTYHLTNVNLIAGGLNKEFDRYLVSSVAIAHDLLEDTPFTSSMLEGLGINKVIISALELLDKTGKEYMEYINKVKFSKLATLVKIADTFTNLEHSLKDGNTKRIIKYSKQLQLLHEGE